MSFGVQGDWCLCGRLYGGGKAFLGVGACPDSSAELESSCNSSVLPESVLLFGGSGFLMGSGVCNVGFLGVLLAREA